MTRHVAAVTLREQDALITRAMEAATNHLPLKGEDTSQGE